MRDLLLVAVVFAALPFVLARPHVGVWLWSWIGYMNPHRLAWGFAQTIPFSMLVAAFTFVGMVFTKERLRVPVTTVTVILTMFILWMTLTTFFALDQESAWPKWEKVIKIQVMTYVTMMLMRDRQRIVMLITVIAFSLGIYGFRGGIFTVATGGQYHVLGPEESFIAGNTEIGLALVMTLPLLRYLQLAADRAWVRYGYGAVMVLTGIAILGTQSRGALLGGAAMAATMLLKSRKKILLGVACLVAIPLMIAFMPERWTNRMETIQTYEQDDSAMQRLYAWRFGYEMANQRFLGGGFGSFNEANYLRFSPELVLEAQNRGMRADLIYQSAHSIYFDVLGEHGYVGLVLYLLLAWAAWRTASRVVRAARKNPEHRWAGDLAAMLQVSLVGFGVGGAFLSLAYFDLAYQLIVILVLLDVMIKTPATAPQEVQATAANAAPARAMPPAPVRRSVRTPQGVK